MPLSLELKSRCKNELNTLNYNIGNYLDLLKMKHQLIDDQRVDIDQHRVEIDTLKRRLDGLLG